MVQDAPFISQVAGVLLTVGILGTVLFGFGWVFSLIDRPGSAAGRADARADSRAVLVFAAGSVALVAAGLLLGDTYGW